MAVGGASIVSSDKGTSLSDIIINSQVGWIVEPEQASKLADAIISAIESPLLQHYRLNARKYAEEYLGEQTVLPRFEAMLSELAKSR